MRSSNRGNFNNLNNFCKKMSKKDFKSVLHLYGQEGVEALRTSTPKDTGKTADSWSYEIIEDSKSINLAWTNTSSTINGVPIVILLRWGHATGSGGYVEGREFISPAIQPIFDRFVEVTWKEIVTS